jgi:formate-dependent nitrite reductase membrane component NrfD
VPLYFFAGGLAGIGALVGAIGLFMGAGAALVFDAHAMAAACALVSPLLLVSDLGRPGRFLNMLRVFKIQSPMSVGAWTLALFVPATLAALGLDLARGGGTGLSAASIAVNVAAALTGLLLATYTGVLLGVTAIPIWARHAALLPVHFGASSLGAGASAIELLGHGDAALNVLALVAAVAETAIALLLRLRGAGATGRAIRLGEVGSGLLPLLLRTVLSGLPGARTAAAVAAIGGALLTRIGWIEAGKETAK